MANEKATKKVKTPTAKKREIQSQKRKMQNKSFKSKIKTALYSFKESLKNDDAAKSKQSLNPVFSLLDKGAKKNVIKKNKADRLKSRLSLLLSKR